MNIFKSILNAFSGANNKSLSSFKTRPDDFAVNCLKISNYKGDERKNLELAPYQRYVLNTIVNNRQTIFKMPRLSTKSTLAIISTLHYALFNDNVTVAFTASKYSNIQCLMNKAYEFCCDLNNIKLFEVSEFEPNAIHFKNGSRILFLTLSGLLGKLNQQEMIDFLILDEFAFFGPKDDEAIMERISGKNIKLAIFSTSKGDSKFDRMFDNAMYAFDDSDIVPISINYREIPAFTKERRKEIIKNMGLLKFIEEYM
jgi:hypothetical protein